jgi:hypothetical protein
MVERLQPIIAPANELMSEQLVETQNPVCAVPTYYLHWPCNRARYHVLYVQSC